MQFRAEFLNKNEEGGRRAADELLVSVRQYLKQLEMDVENTDIVVRAYANLQGLGKHCVRDGLIKTTADLGLFANGFTKRQPLFDFVDVGLGKERADDKLRGITRASCCSVHVARLTLVNMQRHLISSSTTDSASISCSASPTIQDTRRSWNGLRRTIQSVIESRC